MRLRLDLAFAYVKSLCSMTSLCIFAKQLFGLLGYHQMASPNFWSPLFISNFNHYINFLNVKWSLRYLTGLASWQLKINQARVMQGICWHSLNVAFGRSEAEVILSTMLFKVIMVFGVSWLFLAPDDLTLKIYGVERASDTARRSKNTLIFNDFNIFDVLCCWSFEYWSTTAWTFWYVGFQIIWRGTSPD